jgi:hypothetical protein
LGNRFDFYAILLPGLNITDLSFEGLFLEEDLLFFLKLDDYDNGELKDSKFFVISLL